MRAATACLALVLAAGAAISEDVVISGFQRDGRLEFNQVPFAKHYRVDWAPAPGADWTNTWDALNDIMPTGGETIAVRVATTYRVVATLFEHVIYSSESVEDNLWSVNKQSGASQRVGPTVTFLSALASDPGAGVLYGHASGNLYRIDPGTGAGALVGPIGYSPDGLAFDEAAGVLYGVTYAGSFLRVNTATGQGILVANLSGPDLLDSLAYVPQEGRLYVSAILDDTLWRIDPATGAPELAGPIGFSNVSGLGYDESTDTLYGASRSGGDLIRLDRTTGAGEFIGDMPYSAFQSLTVHRQ